MDQKREKVCNGLSSIPVLMSIPETGNSGKCFNMFSSFIDLAIQYAIPVSAGIVLTLGFQALFSSGIHRRIRQYQIDLVKSRSEILELQAKNEELKKSLNDREWSPIKDRLFLN
jgi:hypothetical protein